MSTPSAKFTVESESALLVAFVNTLDVESQADAIGDRGALERWIASSKSGLGPSAVDAGGHRRALALRESLRALLRANNGGEVDGDDLAPLAEAAERAAYGASLDDTGMFRIDPAGAGVDALEARLLLAIDRLQLLGGWPRLKACPADDCQWAFFDTSRNHSRTWCSMDVCGNRSKTRRYRSRRARR